MLGKTGMSIAIILTVAFGQSVYKTDGNVRLSPRVLNYQGFLTDTLGNPITNPAVSMTFGIWSSSGGGTQLWSETQPVSISKGIFSALLGTLTPVPDSVFTKSTDRWLELTVGGVTLAPRTRIVSVGYAVTSTYSDTAFSVVDNAITTPKILDTAVTMAKIAHAGAASGQVIKWSGASWQPGSDLSSADNHWAYLITDTADTTLQMGGRWGLARPGNVMYGAADSTHVSFGVSCTTGISGQDFKYCTVAGGLTNKASGYYSTVSGGTQNVAGNASGNSCPAVGGGFQNSASGDFYATVSGGCSNDASGYTASTVAGGYNNTASNSYTAIGGGQNNTASGANATVGGGQNNTVSYSHATVAGGYGNTAGGIRATVSGGYQNTAINNSTTISGGYSNQADSNYSTVGGGYDNTVSGYSSVISGGCYNIISESYATICGGVRDTVKAIYGAVLGGYSNLAGDETKDTSAVVVGGWNNSALGKYSFVGGGYQNTASGSYATVTGGNANTANGNYHTFIGGGSNNSTGSNYAAVCGGLYNNASSQATAIGGGAYNTASSDYSTVAGGQGNTASGAQSTIGGGVNNEANSPNATIAGGFYCVALNNGAAVGGGDHDSSLANYSFTVGSNSTVLVAHFGSAAFNGQTSTASGETRVGILTKNTGNFAIDHPLDPENKILNHYFVESPEMVLIYRGSAVIGADGKAIVHLPDYFDALNEAPMIQLTGIKSNDVWVEEKVKGNEFVIGGKPSIEVYWTVTGARKDPSAEIAKIIIPVEQPKEGGLANRSLDDEFLVTTMAQLESMGKAGGFKFRHASEQKRYEEMKQQLENSK